MRSGRIVIVSLNPAIDRTLVLDEYAEGKTNPVSATITKPGGKGINVSFALKNLGVDFLTTGIKAGEGGLLIEKALNEKGIKTDFFPVSGETRINYKVYTTANGITTEMNEKGQVIPREQFGLFVRHLQRRLENCDILVLSGSIPRGFPDDAYLVMAGAAAGYGVKVILDTNGRNLRNNIGSGFFAIKPNRDEFDEYVGRRLDSVTDIAKELEKIVGTGTTYGIVSMGKDGAVVSSGGRTLYAASFDIPPVSPVGAGDSMVAAFIYCMINGMDLDSTARWMVAVSTVCASLEAGCYPALDQAGAVLDKIKIKEI